MVAWKEKIKKKEKKKYKIEEKRSILIELKHLHRFNIINREI